MFPYQFGGFFVRYCELDGRAVLPLKRRVLHAHQFIRQSDYAPGIPAGVPAACQPFNLQVAVVAYRYTVTRYSGKSFELRP